MSFVPASHMALVRARREIEKSLASGNWDSIADYDQLLGHQLANAFDDPQRNQQMLMSELEKILGLYSEIVRALPQATIENWRKSDMAF